MTTPPPDEKRPEEEHEAVEDASKSGDLATQQQQMLLQQQLQQQQLQLLQLQQQQLQNMSPSELQQMSQQLALFMMPMMPFMMPLQQQQAMAAANVANADPATASLTSEAVTDSTDTSVNVVADPTSDASPNFQSATTEASGLTPPPVSTDGFGLLGPAFGTLGVPGNEETPKRKRGRPPKKDVAARAKAESEKNLKQQFPMWGYGLPMPLLSGFPGMMPLGNPGAVVKDHSATAEDQVKEEIDASQETGERPAKMAKKKPRGTGKPRGRPRTRPRPGEIIRRVKPLPIAPANYSVMYNYSLSSLAQKSAELNADGDAAADTTAATTDGEAAAVEDTNDENRLAPLATSLLSGEHE